MKRLQALYTNASFRKFIENRCWLFVHDPCSENEQKKIKKGVFTYRKQAGGNYLIYLKMKFMNLIFEGKSEGLPGDYSFEKALQDAINKDPMGKPGTDYYEYDVVEIKCSFGGIAKYHGVQVKISRPE